MSLHSLEMSSINNLRTTLILNEENWNDWSTKVKSRLNSESLLYTILYDKEEECLGQVELEDTKDMVDEMILAAKRELAAIPIKQEDQAPDSSGKGKSSQKDKKPQDATGEQKDVTVEEKKMIISFKKLIKLKKDKKVAANIIVTGLMGTMLELVKKNIDNPFSIWQTLCQHFLPKTQVMNQQLKFKLLRLRKKPNQLVDLFAAEVEELANKINETSGLEHKTVYDGDKIAIYLNGLPDEYRGIIDAISVQDEVCTNWEKVKALVKTHELKYTSS